MTKLKEVYEPLSILNVNSAKFLAVNVPCYVQLPLQVLVCTGRFWNLLLICFSRYDRHFWIIIAPSWFSSLCSPSLQFVLNFVTLSQWKSSSTDSIWFRITCAGAIACPGLFVELYSQKKSKFPKYFFRWIVLKMTPPPKMGQCLRTFWHIVHLYAWT